MSTSPRDPVSDMVAIVDRGAFRRGWTLARGTMPTWATVIKTAIIAFLLGVAAVFGWAGASAQEVPVAAEQYRRDLTRIAQSVWGLDAPVALLAAQIHQESDWNAGAVSRVGAGGLAQFMPATARDMGARYGGPVNVFDPRWAMLAQSRYMRELLRAIDAVNPSERYAFALAGYNGGLGRVRQRQALSSDPRRCFGATCDINPGIAPSNQTENREYPRRIMFRLAPRYHQAKWGGPDLHSRYAITGG